jgi:HD-GYP domain-containing protein (c-di-GMP phosphodiesterase class II)
MLKTIKAHDLKIGMYVILSQEWFTFDHPFLKNQFKIKSQKQIKKIIDYGIVNVLIDTDKSPQTVENVETTTDTDVSVSIPKEWRPEKLIPEEFRDVINDKNLPPAKKAKSIYKLSLVVMNKLLNTPTAQYIEEFKEGVSDMVDLIIIDDDTSSYLLNITSHDFYTYTHSVNVGVYSVLSSKALFKNSTLHNMRELGAGFFLHDIGKVKVNPNIINKKGKLTDDEISEMRTHPEQGFKILSEADQLSEECKVIVMQHHERYDGTGYPLGLKGDNIHLYGRICSIADVFDALTSERPYKTKLNPFAALKLMKEEMINHFQKEIFEEFVCLFKSSSGGR